MLHASLSILIESAVMMKASAHARCPRCGLGSAAYENSDQHKFCIALKNQNIWKCHFFYLVLSTFTTPNVELWMCAELSQYKIGHLPKKGFQKINCAQFHKTRYEQPMVLPFVVFSWKMKFWHFHRSLKHCAVSLPTAWQGLHHNYSFLRIEMTCIRSIYISV